MDFAAFLNHVDLQCKLREPVLILHCYNITYTLKDNDLCHIHIRNWTSFNVIKCYNFIAIRITADITQKLVI